MRYPKEHKAEVRARIVEAAARALRRGGLDGVSVPALMRGAGLTHGGFYAHFESRDALVAEAVALAASQTSGVFERAADLAASLDRYLSMGHVAHPEEGCVIAALGADGARAEGAPRRAFSEAAKGLLRHVYARRTGRRDGALDDASLALAAAMVGAVVLARLVDDDALAARILKAVRETQRG
ncbi:MAG: helix-turn-helix domain-containing protein [Polyangiales bacterium]